MTCLTPERPTRPTPAPKEWAVVCAAAGEQILDLRKGGIKEDGRHFVAVHPYGSTPPWSTRSAPAPPRGTPLGRRLAPAAPVGEPIRLDGWADVVRVATITEQEQLEAIESKLIWTGDYAESRFSWKKRDPLWVLALRVHRLTEPITVPWREDYGGCTSWVELVGLPDDPTTVP
jgi:hypothetical protein